MPAIVGLLAPNGRVGSAALRHLTAAHIDRKLKLVVLYRPNSPPKQVTEGVGIDTRMIDLEGDANQMDKAVKGLNIVISTVAATAVHLQVSLVDALAKSPDFVTLIPAKFGSSRWTPEEEKLPQIAPFSNAMNAAGKRAREVGVNVTTVNAGIFDEFFFGFSFLGADIKKNKIQLNDNHLKHGLPISSVDYLGAVLATLASQSPDSIANKEYSAVEVQPSGQELIEIFAKLNGNQSPERIDFTDKDREQLLQQDGLGPVVAAYFKNWDENSWENGEAVLVPGYKTKTLEQIARSYTS